MTTPTAPRPAPAVASANRLSQDEVTTLERLYPNLTAYTIRPVERGTLRYHEVLAYGQAYFPARFAGRFLGVVHRAELQS